jgi:hypothetical protein
MLATLSRTRPLLGEAPSAFFLREQSIVGRLSRHFRLPEEGVRKRLSELRQSADSKPLVAARVETVDDATPRRVRATELPAWEREAIELMLLGDDFAQRLTQDLDEIDFGGAARELFVAFRDAALAGEATYDRLMASIEEEQLRTLLIEIDELAAGRTSSDPLKRLNDLLQNRERRHEGAARGEQISALRKGELCESDADQAVAALVALRKRRETGSPSTEG